MRGTITVETLKDGLLKLLRAVGELRSDVDGLNRQLASFANGRKLRSPGHVVGFDFMRGESSKTGEPRNRLEEALRKDGFLESPEAQFRALRAIGQDLEGALADIRAARSAIEAIRDDSDLRAEFKNMGDRRR